MNAKAVIIGIIIAIIALISIYLLITPSEVGYSDNPRDWVKQGKVDVDLTTKGTGYINQIGQQYRDDSISTVFEIEGYYQGTYFSNVFLENNREKMRITNDMHPYDGVIEGFMTEKKENGKWIVDIFVDSDWKEKVGPTNIYWGVMYKQEKKFVFNEIDNGIYHDQIIDDKDRFLEGDIATFGVIVGDITKEDTARKTLMKLI